MEQSKLAPTGGPAGYNYSLFLALKKANSNITFLNNKIEEDISIKHKLINYLKSNIKWLYNLIYLVKLFKPNNYVDFQKYDIVHFHNTTSLFACRQSLKNFKGKVLLTSHSPVPFFQEFKAESLSTFEKFLFGPLYRIIEYIDLFSFNKANIIIFPTTYSEESYQKNWKNYSKKVNKSKVRFLLTGTHKKVVKISKFDIKKELKINRNDFLVSYSGRHNFVKGYDLLKKIALNLFNTNNNIKFLLTGKISTIKPLNHNNWIEIGWTKNSNSYINASDLFILPNRETYFDLVLLEALSFGKIVLISNTGGNKFFKNLSRGIFIYDDINDACNLILKIQKLSNEEKKLLENENFSVFKKFFTNSIFLKNYINLLSGL